MGKKCIVIGAGFSKSISNLPTMNGMIDNFMKLFKSIKSNDLQKDKRTNEFGEVLTNFLHKLEKFFLREKLCNGTKTNNNVYADNFEYLMTFIDLSLKDGNVSTENKGDFTMTLFPNIFSQKELKEVKNAIKHYLYLSLINDSPDKQILEDFFNKLIIEPDTTTIISLNYDLILEKYLFRINIWFPNDGYGFRPSNTEKVNDMYQYKKSRLKILKLPGSLNWEYGTDVGNIELKWYDNNSKYFFPNFLAEEKKVLPDGGIRPTLILPSYIKEFESLDLINIWNIASNSLRDAEEIIFIGYSLPSADSAVRALLAGVDFSKKIVKIINNDNSLTMGRNYDIALRENNYEFISKKIGRIPKYNLEEN